jgi:hypothetical protein
MSSVKPSVEMMIEELNVLKALHPALGAIGLCNALHAAQPVINGDKATAAGDMPCIPL